MPIASDPTNSHVDEVFALINAELHRQQNQIELIASENFTSTAVMKAQGSILTNKYAEGYPGRRYYGGCEVVDQIEQLAIDRAKHLFGCSFANVQPNSGSQANQAVFFATLSPGDKILGMSLAAGGHLTHGAPPNQSGKWFHAESYGVNADGWIDYDELEQLAKHHQPKLLIAGGSAYPRIINFARMRDIADSCGAILLVDMAHFAGLVAGKAYPSPFDYAHIVTTTTHKTLRGPRGGIIMTNDPDLAKKINSAIFPGIQGGPLMHVIAGKAIALKEAAEKSFQTYASNVVANAKSLAATLIGRGHRLVSNGTDSHLILVNLTQPNGDPGITGKIAEKALEEAGLTCNKNAVPNDPLSPLVTSGIRLGTPAGTTRGFGEDEFNIIGHCIADVLDTLNNKTDQADPKVLSIVREKVQQLCSDFPLYHSLNP
jgi:glycine hydroxymethyltransferase